MDYRTPHKKEVEKEELIPVKSRQRGDLVVGKTSDEECVLSWTSRSLTCKPQQRIGRGECAWSP